MNISFFTTIKPFQFIKCTLIPALALSTFGVIASEYHYSIDLDESYPYVFEDGVDKTIDIDLQQAFSAIESVCLEGMAESGMPSSMFLSETSEPLINDFSYTLKHAKVFIYPFGVVSPEEPIPATPYLESFDACFTIESNFIDGIATFDLNFSGDDLAVTSLDIVVNGVSDKTLISSEISSESNSVIATEGGKLTFNTQITNFDIDFSEKDFRTWAYMSFPNGDIYPVKGAHRVNLQYQESKTIDTRFFVPSWFGAGEYTITVYVADILTGDRITSSFNFTKLSDTE